MAGVRGSAHPADRGLMPVQRGRAARRKFDMIPQILVILWLALAGAVEVANNGRSNPRECLWTLLVFVVYASLLVWGGFFDCFWEG